MSEQTAFRLTYSTMYNPPEELHTGFDLAVETLKANLGKEYGMIINNEDHFSSGKYEKRSPINQEIVLGVFQKGGVEDAAAALDAAGSAAAAWGRTPWEERIALLRRAADLIDERIFEFGAVIAMEVGKNRMEALADAAETADLIRYACDQLEANNGFIKPMGKDPLQGYESTNVSVLRPYGVWLVISPFNFPCALTGGPVGAALAAGNAVVMKPATDTPFTVRLLAECLRDAGLPDGVMNYVTGPGSSMGQALIDSPELNGITFTGSFDVGMGIYRNFAQGDYVRPVILELGGKNPAIVSRHADIDRATQGIIRSSFGLQGQKCSACSRIYVEAPVYDEVLSRLVEATNKLVVGNPTDRATFMGPVINKGSYQDYQDFSEELSQDGTIRSGGKILTDGDFGRGYFCTPTLVSDVPRDHRLWQHEMFLPITMVEKVENLAEAMRLANGVKYGLTAGFYGSEEEVGWFFEN
ncbi:MAG TPA: aldehyde dehydrogenase family protein, partial [Anaerolineales bacterium]|nr:aldehyde dehydrogenase family protein [Anaerolineales bacterium]